MLRKFLLRPFSVLFVVVLISSCSIEKRVHLPGYHVQWKNLKSKSVGNINSHRGNQISKDLIALTSIAYKDFKSPSSKVDKDSNTPLLLNTPLLAFLNDIAPSYKLKGNKSVSDITSIKALKSSYPQLDIKDDIEDLEEEIQRKKTNSWIWIAMELLGLILFWFVSILLGLLLVLGSIIAIIILSIKVSKLKDKLDKLRYETSSKASLGNDVVYLKNGSVINGTIIEQVIGKSIKIKTADGNVFFYNLDEVKKFGKKTD